MMRRFLVTVGSAIFLLASYAAPADAAKPVTHVGSVDSTISGCVITATAHFAEPVNGAWTVTFISPLTSGGTISSGVAVDVPRGATTVSGSYTLRSAQSATVVEARLYHGGGMGPNSWKDTTSETGNSYACP